MSATLNSLPEGTTLLRGTKLKTKLNPGWPVISLVQPKYNRCIETTSRFANVQFAKVLGHFANDFKTLANWLTDVGSTTQDVAELDDGVKTRWWTTG